MKQQRNPRSILSDKWIISLQWPIREELDKAPFVGGHNTRKKNTSEKCHCNWQWTDASRFFIFLEGFGYIIRVSMYLIKVFKGFTFGWNQIKHKQNFLIRTLDQSSFNQITSFAKFYQRSNPKDLKMSLKETFHSKAAFLNVYHIIHATFMDNKYKCNQIKSGP